MAALKRKTVMNTFASLFTYLGNDGTFKKISRRFAMADKVAAGDKPCLLITSYEENSKNDNISDPGIITLDATLWIYTDVGLDQEIVPADVLDDLIDAVMVPLQGNSISGRVTLGNIVADVRWNGKLSKNPGDINGKGIAMIPLKILLPSF